MIAAASGTCSCSPTSSRRSPAPACSARSRRSSTSRRTARRATVLTTTSTAYPVSDPSLAAEIPAGTRVIRAFEPRSVGVLQRLATIAFNRVGLRTATAGWRGSPSMTVSWGSIRARLGLPGPARGRESIYSTGGPEHTAHIVAAIVHRLTGIPWGPIPGTSGRPIRTATRRRSSGASTAVERRLASRATAVTVVADYFRIAGARPQDVTVIPNGVDEEDFGAALPDRGDDAGRPLRLSHVGTLYGDRDGGPVLDAMRRLIAAGRLDAGAIELRVVGSDSAPGPRRARAGGAQPHRLCRAPGGRRGDATSGRAAALRGTEQPRAVGQAVRVPRQRAADPRCRPSRQPGVAPGAGVERRRLGRAGRGPAIEAAILELLDRRRNGRLTVDPSVRSRALERYSRRALTGRLAEVLAAAAGQR